MIGPIEVAPRDGPLADDLRESAIRDDHVTDCDLAERPQLLDARTALLFRELGIHRRETLFELVLACDVAQIANVLLVP